MITTKRLKISVSLIIFIVILANNICFANIDDDEVIDINEIKRRQLRQYQKYRGIKAKFENRFDI